MDKPATVYLVESHPLQVSIEIVYFVVNDELSTVTIPNVFYVENIKSNLLSYSVINSKKKLYLINALPKFISK